MAEEQQEDIIIIEEQDVEGAVSKSSQDKDASGDGLKKKKIIIFSAVIAVIIISIVLIYIFKSSTPQEVISTDFIDEKLIEDKKVPIPQSKLENMIAKANYLYSTGSKEEALYLYEKIAIYSEAISQYNLGVAQLKDAQYNQALQTFQKAIVNDEKRCVSAINAAVCSLHLNDKESFDYYIDLAYAYLPNEINSPLYSYYYALINYYNNNYLEALSALKNPTSNEYPQNQKHLSAKINALFGNNYDAIESLENNFIDDDALSIGLLYSRVGDLTLAKKYLTDAVDIANKAKDLNQDINQTKEDLLKAKLALSFINLKSGQVKTASNQLKEATDEYEEQVYKPYPIKVTLKESLFDPYKAQAVYRNIIYKDKNQNYQKIFYFSPYKIFNADQTISYIRKGAANIYIDNIDSAKRYLRKSASSSNVNIGITKAIKKALAFDIREANIDLQKLVKIQPKHSILHYNLGLTYAQLGDMINAHKHFLRSYHLDAKNYLSGIFAIMSSQLINKENKKLISIITDSINEEKDSEEKTLYTTLLQITKNDILALASWFNNDFKQRPLYLALDIIIALKLNNLKIAKKSANKLSILLPNEILPHLMYIDANFIQIKPENYAKNVISYLKKQDFHFNDLYYGPAVTQYLYIQNNLVTGQLYYLVQQLKDQLESTTKNKYELTKALALAQLYDKAYEESYTLYNHLIDDLKVRDARTLFLGAVASTAANHHENAIALLELSKLKDSNFLESRYALGLLYIQVKNNKGAVIQFSRVGDNNFISKYFNFEIDTDKLLFEKQFKEKLIKNTSQQ